MMRTVRSRNADSTCCTLSDLGVSPGYRVEGRSDDGNEFYHSFRLLYVVTLHHLYPLFSVKCKLTYFHSVVLLAYRIGTNAVIYNPYVYVTLSFIFVLKRVRHWTLS
jgi:hypothetical protein